MGCALTKSIDAERRLVAIFAADVDGYSRLMGSDEVGTLRDLTECRRILDSLIALHRGRIANTAGDSVLAEFSSAVDAAQCAIEAQVALAEANGQVSLDRQIKFRIGVHVGDVMVRAGDLFGDGVNVAARLEGIAEPGGVCVSDDAYRQIRGKIDSTFEDMGARSLKNIAEPMRVWRIQSVSRPTMSTQAEPLALPDKPSIAVLPFQNMSGDPEQEYFADGMVDDITTALSRFKALFVIARNSSFTYKGRAIDIKQVGRELGVRYVLEGSVRKAAGKVRITGQLIDATTGAHLWADRFEGNATDIFALQDAMTDSIVSAIAPRVLQAEIELAARSRPDNLSAYDLYLRATPRYCSLTREGLSDALQLLGRALEIDPRYGAAASLAANCHLFNVVQGWATDPKSGIKEATRLSRMALSIDENDPEALAIGGHIVVWSGDLDTAIEMVDRAVELNPNSARAWNERGWTYRHSEQTEEAIQSFERAIRMSPLDPMLHLTLTGMATAFIELRRFDEAVAVAKKALRRNQTFSTTYRCLAAALAHLGRDEEAREAAARLLELDPNYRISGSSQVVFMGRGKARLFVEGLRKAGLPE
jgi:adenylate cyclase